MIGRSLDNKKLSSFEQCNLSSNKDEIDLIELASIISKSYKIVAFITVIFVFLGVGLTLLSPKNWLSSAIVSLPSERELQSLDSVNSSLLLLNIDANISQDDIFGSFKKNYSSRDLFNKYADNLDVKPVGSVDVSRLITDKNMSDYLENKNSYVLNYKSNSDLGIKDTLAGYISYVNKQVNNEVNYQISFIIDNAKKTATEEYQLALQLAKNEQIVRIQKLEYAASIAKAAGLQKPTHDEFDISGDSNNYPISLGYDALSRELDIERSITDLTTVNIDLLNKKMHLDKIMALKPIYVYFQSFSYLQQPSDPIVQDTKKRILIVILFGFVGLVGAIGFVLVRHYVRERQDALVRLPKE
ncbi:Wzz/FepE/Etk N-terminal domain-containing protein [Yersinia aleksiciae]|uniref:O-antigen chain length determinant n=1 Tax=Yersinia aleksiciae TaxID=263819 RepID=A0ABM5UFL7_YERAE|nr:Wzz/FepE/Etk N-terminal domain-containing protein [Yersinia aleksiciae]AKP34615.1 O-antigen chain length determinant [Yersinia aleksiciae]CFQ44824.1 O-antigen chain length determinant [Yersinia aleksiciae]